MCARDILICLRQFLGWITIKNAEFFSKTLYFTNERATCSELPSNISTTGKYTLRQVIDSNVIIEYTIVHHRKINSLEELQLNYILV